MPIRRPGTLNRNLAVLHKGAALVIGVAALGLAAMTVAGAIGFAPHLVLPIRVGEVTYEEAGLVVQGGLAAFLLALVATMPSGHRVLVLESSHRDFQLAMSDVAEAYRACHAADRAGAFTMSGEFDAVRERITHLRRHPDLGALEPAILEMAAMMSHTSRELAETYSDAAVSRARRFLDQRQEEIATFAERLDHAKGELRALGDRHAVIADGEASMQADMDAIEDEFGDMLRALGYAGQGDETVIRMREPTVAEATAAE